VNKCVDLRPLWALLQGEDEFCELAGLSDSKQG
jgi:hypothetical protein